MNLKEYKKIVSKHSKKEDIFKNVIVAFLVGGLMGVIGELIFKFFSVNLGLTDSAMDHRSEGLIKGIGSNIFKMTGSIILYGLVSAFFFAIIKGVVMWQYILKMPI